jgi:hypothetical protein
MKSTEFHPVHYDAHGRLRLPLLFWLVLLLQARTWVLFVIAGASREQGTALLNLFYPDHDNFWLGLIPGIPAVLAFLLSGRRASFPRIWHVLYFLLLLTPACSKTPPLRKTRLRPPPPASRCQLSSTNSAPSTAVSC